MRSCLIFVFASIMSVVFLPAPLLAIEEASTTPDVSGKPGDFKYPFFATVTGNNVYIRSGKGTAYYQCGKLNQDERVTVVDEIFGWAKIVPPEGSYSWINKNYVEIDPPGSNKGVVTGENVRVWAGSDYIEPMRSSSMQVKLNKNREEIEDDDFVELYADQPEEGDYYKIKPPAGAYLWISAEFLAYAGPFKTEKSIVIPPREEVQVTPAPAPEEKKPEFQPIPESSQEQAPAEEVKLEEPAQPEPENIKPQTAEPESSALTQCYAIAEKIDEELKKPVNQQSYDAFEKTLSAIAESQESEQATAFAKILIQRIKRYELAISVSDVLNEQDKQLAKTMQQIESAHKTQVKKIPKEVTFMYTGMLKPSHVYTEQSGQKRYLLMDPNGRIICYIVSGSPDVTMKLEKYVDTKIGIDGDNVSDDKSLVAIISATKIDRIQ